MKQDVNYWGNPPVSEITNAKDRTKAAFLQQFGSVYLPWLTMYITAALTSSSGAVEPPLGGITPFWPV